MTGDSCYQTHEKVYLCSQTYRSSKISDYYFARCQVQYLPMSSKQGGFHFVTVCPFFCSTSMPVCNHFWNIGVAFMTPRAGDPRSSTVVCLKIRQPLVWPRFRITQRWQAPLLIGCASAFIPVLVVKTVGRKVGLADPIVHWLRGLKCDHILDQMGISPWVQEEVYSILLDLFGRVRLKLFPCIVVAYSLLK
jgi:hypothetical protein